jgi:hypothetical protein
MWWVTILDFLILVQTNVLVCERDNPKPTDMMMPNITEAF